MSIKNINGSQIYYEEIGEGSETIVFAHGLLWNGHMFDEQIAVLKDSFRCIKFDFKGHGESETTESGYEIDNLTSDTKELIKTLVGGPCHFVGVSMGGFVGMRLAIRHPELIKSLTLIGTTADPEPADNVPRYKRLNFVARWFGLGLIANRVMTILFGQKFLIDQERIEQKNKWRNILIANNRVGINKAVNAVIYREGVYDQLDQINVPTLIMVGDQDTATVPENSKRIHKCIEGSQLEIVLGAGHTATVEEPGKVNAALSAFLAHRK